MCDESNESDSEYNIHSRPKRKIFFNKAALKQFEVAAANESSDESDDEDFVPSDAKSNNVTINGSFSDCDESNSSETENVNNFDDDKSESIPKSTNKETKKPKTKYLTKKQSVEEKKMPKTSKKTKKPLLKKKGKKSYLHNLNSDEETQKFISSFKNSQIIKKPKQAIGGITKALIAPVNKQSGPYIKRIQHNDESLSYSSYQVYQLRTSGELSERTTANMTRIIPKEKIMPIVDKSVPWTCGLCHQGPNHVKGLGDLFGPYRIDLSDESDQKAHDSTCNQQLLLSLINICFIIVFFEGDFKEIWLHEGCAVWTPGICLKESSLQGISMAMSSSANLVNFYSLLIVNIKFDLNKTFSNRNVIRAKRMAPHLFATSTPANACFTFHAPLKLVKVV